jgi:hypothetical protein
MFKPFFYVCLLSASRTNNTYLKPIEHKEFRLMPRHFRNLVYFESRL